MKIITKIVAVCCLWGLSSCDSYLDVNQPSIYTDQSLYKTPADCEASIAGVYSQLQTVYNRNYLEAIVLREDAIKNMNNNITRFTDTSTEKTWETAWKSLWVLVSRSNKILDNIDRVDFSDEDQKNHIKGEAYAMRGLAYLQFAWCWGGSPLITTDLSLAELRKVKRSSQEETYQQAIKDFELAYDLLPEKRSGTEVGRITKYAMAGMLGRTYLYMHNPAKAVEWLKLIIAKEPALYKMADNYEDCFDDKFDNTSERVWEVQYMGGSTGKALGISQTFNSMLLASSINLEKDAPFLHNVTFKGPSGTAQVSESIWGEGVYEEGDIRRAATMVNNLYYDKDYQHADTYTARKFLKATQTKPGSYDEWGNNISILRYTDVKLMYAEALNETKQSPDDEVFEYIDKVRERAGLDGVEKAWTEHSKRPDKFRSKEGMREIIHRERLIELAMEGHAMWDLRRWKEAEEWYNRPVRGWNINKEEAEEFYKQVYLLQRVYSKKNYLWPIKDDEIRNNPKLIQNYGW